MKSPPTTSEVETNPRSHASQAAAEHLEQLIAIMEHVPAFVSYVDRDLRYRCASKHYEEYFGRSRELIVGYTMQKVHGEEAWARIEPHMMRALNGMPARFEAQIVVPGRGARLSEGHFMPHKDINGTVCGVVIFVHDITEQKKFGRELQDKDAFYHSIFESCGVMNIETDHMEGKILRINRLTCDLLGYEESELLGGKTSFDITHPEDRARNNEMLQSLVNGEVDNFRIEKRYVRKDGTIMWVDVAVTSLRDTTGKSVRLLRTAQDITDRKRAEQRLMEADRHKDEFLATLAHELRNPLAPISYALQIWKKLEQTPERLSHLRPMLERQVAQLKHLIDDLLDISRISQGKIGLRTASLDLASVITTVVETAQPALDAANHRIDVRLPAHPVWIDGDVGRLTQTFGNLVHNAAKYTHTNGAISITLSVEEPWCEVRVRDNGTGIPRDMLERIFEPFAQVEGTLDQAQGGLGIGLTLARTLVSLHKGTIHALSDGPGSGSEFIVRLPVLDVTQGNSPRLLRSASSPEPTTDQIPSLRILVVDDLCESADTLKMMLDEMGLDTRVAYDATTALRTAASFKPDVIFSDLAMPGHDGYRLAGELNALLGAEMVLVALTGFGQHSDRERSRKAGFDFHLVKPTNRQAIREIILNAAPKASSRAVSGQQVAPL